MQTLDPVRSERLSTGDVIAGVSVAVVVIPQALAYAELAGMPAYTGLYAAALPPLAAAFFASSRYLQTGPVAMTSLLTFGALSAIAEPFSARYVGLALVLALIVGVVRVALGLVGGGGITNFMSNPVVLGFTTGATLLIIASQSAVAFGVETAPAGLRQRLWHVATNPDEWSLAAIGLSVLTILLVRGGRRIHPLFPGVLVAVLIGMAVGTIEGMFELVGDVPSGLPPISLDLPWGEAPGLVLSGAIIAVVGFAEATAISRTFAAQDRVRWNASRELVSQGIANLASGLSGGFPVGGSFSRSSINKLAGARSRWSGAITGVAVLAFTPLAGVISGLPRAVLGAIVIAAVLRLVRVRALWRLTNVSWGQAAIAWVTFIATLLLSPRIDLAVLVGMGLAAGVHIYREASRLHIKTHFEDETLTMEPEGVLFYASADAFSRAFDDEVDKHPTVERLVIDLEGLGRIDLPGALELKTFLWDAENAGIATEIVNVPVHASGILDRVARVLDAAGGRRPDPIG